MLFFKGAFPGLRALIAAINKELKSLQPKDSSTIRWTRDSGGMTANLVTPVTNAGGIPAAAEEEDSAGGGGSEPHAVPCKVTGGTSATGYTVKIYGNGVDSDPTGAGILHLTEVAYGSNLPVGAWCLGHPHETALTGGN